MAQLEIRNVSFRYTGASYLTLSDISFDVGEGQFVVICGPSGSGKSTLLKLLKRELRPAGQRTGDIRYKGRPLDEYPLSELAREIGIVMQDPDNQIVADDGLHELVFGMENLGFRTSAMRRKTAEICISFGMESWLHKKTFQLSGGQKQSLNLASVLMTEPKLLLLDEPTAHLDPVAAKEWLHMLQRLNEEYGLTVITAEHRLDDVLPLADRVAVLDRGELVAYGSPREVMRRIWHMQPASWRRFVPAVPAMYLKTAAPPEQGVYSGGASAPEAVDAMATEAPDGPTLEAPAARIPEISTPESASFDAGMPINVKEGKAWVERASLHVEPDEEFDEGAWDADEPIVSCSDVTFQYRPDADPVLSACGIELFPGECTALLGGNGAGKTTLLKLLSGLLRPASGEFRYRGKKCRPHKERDWNRKVGYLPQNPMPFFAHETVEEELRFAAERYTDRRRDAEARVIEMIRFLGLEEARGRHPYDCSGGEKQKTALGCLLLADPEILLLDEPTKGLDPVSKAEIGGLLRELSRKGRAVLFATHDLEFAASWASRCALLFDGSITAEGTPREMFSGSLFFTTSVNRVLRHRWPRAIRLEDVKGSGPNRHGTNAGT